MDVLKGSIDKFSSQSFGHFDVSSSVSTKFKLASSFLVRMNVSTMYSGLPQEKTTKMARTPALRILRRAMLVLSIWLILLQLPVVYFFFAATEKMMEPTDPFVSASGPVQNPLRRIGASMVEEHLPRTVAENRSDPKFSTNNKAKHNMKVESKSKSKQGTDDKHEMAKTRQLETILDRKPSDEEQPNKTLTGSFHHKLPPADDPGTNSITNSHSVTNSTVFAAKAQLSWAGQNLESKPGPVEVPGKTATNNSAAEKFTTKADKEDGAAKSNSKSNNDQPNIFAQKPKDFTTSSKAESNKAKINKPTLLIHIGPSKTGTSTIQRESSYWEGILAKDQWYYVGKFASTTYRKPARIPILFDTDDCWKQAVDEYKQNTTHHFRETECWAKRTAGLEKHRLKGDSLVLSDEQYSYKAFYDTKDPEYFKMLRIALQDWNVVVVPTYRRYHEWYLSGIKEKNRKGCLRIGTWPGSGGNKALACHNLWNPLRKMIHADNFPGPNNYGNLDYTIPFWRNAGFPIKMLNFHTTPEQPHITCAFYCDIIPNAPTMCEHCQKQQGTNQNPSPAALTAYDDIIFAAAQRKLIPEKIQKIKTRQKMVEELVHYHAKAFKRNGLADLPLLCPSQEELEALLEKSLEFEKLIMPDLFEMPHGEEEHRSTYWKLAKEERTFCWVDTETLLNNKTSWKQVLEALNHTDK